MGDPVLPRSARGQLGGHHGTMIATQHQPVTRFDLAATRQAILRYQPASNWVSVSRDPTQRMTVGLGFGVGRAEAPEMLRRVGLDPAAVRSGRMPISDA